MRRSNPALLPGHDGSQAQLWDELDVNLFWMHVLRGTPLDKMGMNGIPVYIMLKTYTNIGTGIARVPGGVPELARRLETSVPTIERALKLLVELGVIERRGKDPDDRRVTLYAFKEKLPVLHKQSGKEIGELLFGDYQPKVTGDLLEDTRIRIRDGKPLPANVTFNVYNVNVVVGDNNTVTQNTVVVAADPEQARGSPVSKEQMSKIRAALRERNVELPLDPS
jgi:DNA-binding Lrp family transcriptional regulator